MRHLSAWPGLDEVADLPASPCLSSRVETGIAIDARSLRNIHAVERWLTRRLAAANARCRLRASGIVVELDPASFEEALADGRPLLVTRLSAKA